MHARCMLDRKILRGVPVGVAGGKPAFTPDGTCSRSGHVRIVGEVSSDEECHEVRRPPSVG